MTKKAQLMMTEREAIAEVYFFRCDRALPAAALESALVRPSRRTCEAAFAAAAEVRSPGALLCVNALPAAFLEFVPDDGLSSTFAADRAALRPVPLSSLIPPEQNMARAIMPRSLTCARRERNIVSQVQLRQQRHLLM
jgi:hypothetical protein